LYIFIFFPQGLKTAHEACQSIERQMLEKVFGAIKEVVARVF